MKRNRSAIRSAPTSKNERPRSVPLPDELLDVLKRRRSARVVGVDSVFHDRGRPIRYFRKAWASSCDAAGCPGTLLNDLCRSAIRNMIRAGVPDRVAMSISGHSPRSLFDRYNVTDERDKVEALRATMRRHRERRAAAGVSTGAMVQSSKANDPRTTDQLERRDRPIAQNLP